MNNLWDQNSLKNRQKNFWNRIPKNNNNNFVSYSSQMSLINNGEDVKVYQRDEYNDSSKNHYLREDKSINNNRLNKFIEEIFMSQEVKDFFTTYSDFVTKVTSEPSLDIEALKKSMDEIESSSDVKIPRLLTAALGLGSESGEFVEIVKKMILQGKPASEENIFHMKRELGDIIWYWTTACASLGLDPYEVISENQKKLEARYGEKFEVQRSEVRKEGDL